MTSGPVTVRVPAKINLHLGVGPLRADGYHDLVTVFQAIGLHDELTAEPADTFALDTGGAPEVPSDGRNLAVRAARLLAAEAGVTAGVRLTLRKDIPVAGGMAGGSADAAAALVGCDALWGLRTPPAELHRLAAQLGSDVPFALAGHTAVGTGRGDRLEPVAALDRTWVVAVASGGLSTPDVYAEVDRQRGADDRASDAGPVLAALTDPDPAVLGAALCNDMAEAACTLRPSLRSTLAAGTDAGALGAMVSGSGPTCVFLARDSRHAQLLAAALTGRCRDTRIANGPVPGATLTSAGMLAPDPV